jgi:hypothetical protein
VAYFASVEASSSGDCVLGRVSSGWITSPSLSKFRGKLAQMDQSVVTI